MPIKQIKPISIKPAKTGKLPKMTVTKVKVPKMHNFTIHPSKLKAAGNK